MPRVIVQAVEGRTDEQKSQLVAEITDAVVRSYAVEPKTVTIVLEDILRRNFAKAGRLYSEA